MWCFRYVQKAGEKPSSAELWQANAGGSEADDVLRLLDTNNGNYAAACALDFVQPPEFYDTFALFDIEGDQYWTRRWPYFRSSKSREALMHNKPVPVKSCWNGMG